MTAAMRLLVSVVAGVVVMAGGGSAAAQAALAQEGDATAAQAKPLVDLSLRVGGLPNGATEISTALEIVIVLSLLTFVPALFMSVTSFARVIIVLGFVRRALGVQDLPPSIVIVGLTLFLTLAIMYPVLDGVYTDAFLPYRNGEIGLIDAGNKASTILRDFLVANTREPDVAVFLDLTKSPPPETPQDLPLRVVVPAFMLSELKTAFQMGFVVYLPFLVIDLVIASILLSMGMFMLPPVMISTPFKILLFIMVDGWELVVRSVADSFTFPGL
ncbi:MAG: flagellar type III secretion system pore protein FliP [Planctomycetota bacterium]